MWKWYDLIEDGKRVRLEVVLLKPNGSGPFPLLVFNHGRIIWTRGSLARLSITHKCHRADFCADLDIG
jgi:hypothetical protein